MRPSRSCTVRMFASLRDSKSGVEKSKQFWLRVWGPPLYCQLLVSVESAGQREGDFEARSYFCMQLMTFVLGPFSTAQEPPQEPQEHEQEVLHGHSSNSSMRHEYFFTSMPEFEMFVPVCVAVIVVLVTIIVRLAVNQKREEKVKKEEEEKPEAERLKEKPKEEPKEEVPKKEEDKAKSSQGDDRDQAFALKAKMVAKWSRSTPKLKQREKQQ